VLTGPRVPGALWVAGYAVLLLAPLVAGAITDPFAAERPFTREMSAACGFLAFTLSVSQTAVISRFATTSRTFGSDRLLALHRAAGLVALAFMGLHPLLLGARSADWLPLSGTAVTRSGSLALWAAVVLVVTSVWRARLGLSFETWQRIHLAATVVILAAGAVHAVLAAGYTAHPAVRWTVLGSAGLALTLLVRRRVYLPWTMLRRPWRVMANRDVGADTRLLRLEPVGHPGVHFEAGQFAWLMTGASPFFAEQHPLSIASAPGQPDGGTIEFAVKALGDWSSRTVPALGTGATVWVDGPYGDFTPDRAAAPRLVLIGGGIGIAPMRAILLDLVRRPVDRPVTLVYATSTPARAVFLDELRRLQAALDLELVLVCESPGDDGQAEPGRITTALLTRRLPPPLASHEYYLCGPLPMIDAVSAALRAAGVPRSRVHTERFQMV
jgi:predicted ferric reductase